MIDHMQTQTVRNQILVTARDLFQTKGFDQTSITDIIERLNLSEGILLGYFESLDEILEVLWSGSLKNHMNVGQK